MGTRSVTYIHDGDRDSGVICAIYRQMDGYPTAMGADIADALGSKTVVNGIGMNSANVVNGMGCAAAQLVAALKDGAGSIYMAEPSSSGEEYNYHVFFDGDRLNPKPDAALSVDVLARGDSIWTGLLRDFDGEEIESRQNEDD